MLQHLKAVMKNIDVDMYVHMCVREHFRNWPYCWIIIKISCDCAVCVQQCLLVEITVGQMEIPLSPFTSSKALSKPFNLCLTFLYCEIGVTIVPTHVKQFEQYLTQGWQSIKMLGNIINYMSKHIIYSLLFLQR